MVIVGHRLLLTRWLLREPFLEQAQSLLTRQRILHHRYRQTSSAILLSERQGNRFRQQPQQPIFRL